jgi:protoheme IX farnesyltransferase
LKPKTVKTYLELSKPRVASLLVFAGLMGGLTGLGKGLGKISPLGFSPIESLIVAVLALAVGVLGANAVTCYIDKDIDYAMERTRHRPLPSGKISPPEKALYYGLTLSLVSLAILIFLNVYSALWFAFGLLDSTLLYNFLTKRRTAWNIVLGSPAGGAPIMVSWSAVTGQPFHLIPFLMAALVVLWTPAHIWSLAIKYSEDYRRANVPMLPTIVDFKTAARCIASTTLLLPVFSTILGLIGEFNTPYYPISYALNAAIVFLSLNLIIRPSKRNAWLLFKFTSPYLAVLLIVIALSA